MTLDDLYEEMELEEAPPININKDAGTDCCVVAKKASKKVLDSEFEDDDDDPEEQLLSTLALLEDCLCVLEEIIDPTIDTLGQKLLSRAEDAALQARAWLAQHEGADR